MISYGEIHNAIDRVHVDASGMDEFVGFRWMNLRRVRNMVSDRLIKLKKAGGLGRNEIGEPLLSVEEWEGILDDVGSSIKRRAEKIGSERDNGHAENCLAFLEMVRKGVRSW